MGCIIPCMVCGVTIVWLSVWVGVGYSILCKCCFSGGYSGDCIFVERDTLALHDLITTEFCERNGYHW